MEEYKKKIHDLHQLHYISKTFKHKVGHSIQGSWVLFEPSRFIYAFFAFNTFYNVSWKSTVKQKRWVHYDNSAFREDEKFYSLIDFIYFNTKGNERKEIFSNYFPQDDGQLQKDYLKCLDSVTLDNNIDSKKKENILRIIPELSNKKDLQVSDFREIIYIIYLVRNNIFHGEKTTIEMSNSEQEKRIRIYADIIIAVNELLFEVLKRKIRGLNLSNTYSIDIFNYEEN